MPIYEYQCRSCSHRFEVLHARSGEATPLCPACGASDVEKLLSAFAVTQESRSAPAAPSCCAGCACRRE